MTETPLAVLELEKEGCQTWQLTPRNISRVDNDIDKLGVFAKGYWAAGDDGRLECVGLRIGDRPGHVIAFYGDWIIRHPDGGFTVHAAAEEASA
ncbi:hypothetical protein OHA37_26860 [Streptomyces sp. NBC_00335]|uniref:hypothetical protein n=1 Tax=unclassified Streptomyces TaxID=2593676 RepID=UPI00225B2446|nr:MULTISPECIES: hypothetical protein [unclassified Streptomyces]MCX5407471.1 hypothetical protein [Streptomyces sp. NBC_00086]